MYIVSVIIQIILESLPISSSGHAQLLRAHMPEYLDRLSAEPTLIVLALYFYKEIIGVLRNIATQWRWLMQWALLIIMATSVTVFFYEVTGQLLHTYLAWFQLWMGFGITALLLFSLRWAANKHDHEPTFLKLFVLGVVQGCARLPGVSRLGTTYTVACWLGFSPYRAFRVSCALQVPLFIGGFLQGAVTAWYGQTVNFVLTPLYITLIVTAMVIAYFLLWAVEALMLRGKLWYVGWYMLAITVLSFLVHYLEFLQTILVR